MPWIIIALSILAVVAWYYYVTRKSNIRSQEYETMDRPSNSQSAIEKGTGSEELTTFPESQVDSLALQGESIQTIISKNESHDLSTPNWQVMLSFGKSSSQNYQRAVFLARAAEVYSETLEDFVLIHQATYSDSPESFKRYLALYDIIKNWKSAFAFVNGRLMDKTTLSKINSCYGSKCRSGIENCSDGKGHYYPNPFGCHKLSFSAWSDPWYAAYEPTAGLYRLDRLILKNKIDAAAITYKYCPSFDYVNMLRILNNMPERISCAEYKKIVDSNGPLYWQQ